MSVAFLFPGQGSQYPGMLHDLLDNSVAEETITEASEVLGFNVLGLDNEKKLKSTISVQLCVLIAGIASARVLEDDGAKPDMVAGHSVGGFGAAVTAGVLNFKDALFLVEKRGKLMESAYPHGYGMGVVLGLSEQKVQAIIEVVSDYDSPVYISNINSTDQIIISGERCSLKRVFEIALSEGARKAHLLDVAVPSHCPLLENVSTEFGAVLENIDFKNSKIPFASNRTGLTLRNAKAIQNDLEVSIANSVRWHEATSILFERGARLFVEMYPKSILTNLAKSAFPNARVISIAENGLKSASFLIKKEKNIT